MVFSIEYFTKWGEELFLRFEGHSLPMCYVHDGIWSVEVDRDVFFRDRESVSYFYEVRTYGVSARHEWMPHRLDRNCGDTIADRWSEDTGWRGAGTAIPVFSLRSRNSFGSGEFYDLKMLVDWAAMTGQSIIQILPVNDTSTDGSWKDSYPYSAISSFALHPQYINLPAIGISEDEDFCSTRDRLNSLSTVDYEQVGKAKACYMRKAFEQNGEAVMRRKNFKDFLRDNSDWLIPYATFCVLRDEYGTYDFTNWGEYSVYDDAKLDIFRNRHKKQVNFHCYIQYQLDLQLSDVREHARAKRILLKGDLPIGVSRFSVEAWKNPELFNMDSQAGAPPDAFSRNGQNWSFPTYNWDRMKEDGYMWWKRRLGRMNRYFDAFRIDHILGFFRIWEIPLPYESGLEGHFSPALPYEENELDRLGFSQLKGLFLEDPHNAGHFHPRINGRDLTLYENADDAMKDAYDRLYYDFFHHRHNDFWKEAAIEKLSALLESTGMLACGEDLGMIPACVPEVMQEMNILSLEIQSMSKNPSREFADTENYPYRCVCSTSTHDTNPLRAWWEEDKERTERFYNTAVLKDSDSRNKDEAPPVCEPWICERIIKQNLDSPAMLVILPLQDWLSLDGELRYANASAERINDPSNPHHYWRYRMHLYLEDLLGQKGFNGKISAMISDSGRKALQDKPL